ncbi:hypothetical protein DKP78_20600 [Enterococcus faecium]|nr:hypothetical protein DKP78_20600 [Enterococcus faecium]
MLSINPLGLPFKTENVDVASQADYAHFPFPANTLTILAKNNNKKAIHKGHLHTATNKVETHIIHTLTSKCVSHHH